MPRLQHQPPKYRLHKGSGQAVASLNGRRVYLGKHGSDESQRRYRELLQEWERNRRSQSDAPPQAVLVSEESLANVVTPKALRAKRAGGVPITLDELIFVYRRHARAYYVKNGKVTREAEMVVEVTDLLGRKHGDEYVDDFGPVKLDDFRDDLITDKDWSRGYINKQVTRLIAMFKWAVAKELCRPEVHARIAALGGLKKGRSAARETPGVTVVEDARVDAALPFLPEIVADMVRFQRLTSARPGEVCSICPCDIDRRGEVWVYTPDEHKTEHHEKHRRVFIGPQAQAVLTRYLLRPGDLFCFSPAESIARARRRQREARTTPLSCGNRAGTNRASKPKWRPSSRYKVASYRLAIRRGCEKAEVKVWTPNQLRHSAATEIRERYGLEAAQVICGHATADVTQVYAERDWRLAVRVAKEMG
ncbi:MAG: site-specific integrase [Planctomycetota bacterium]